MLEVLETRPLDFIAIEEMATFLPLPDVVALVEMGLVERGFSTRDQSLIGYRITIAGRRALG